jgi:AcrR family transcriptional regulator
VPQRRTHSEESILDTTGSLLLARGLKTVTVDAIAQASGAPKGSIYYRFSSRDDIFARLWLRAVERFRTALLGVAQQEDPLETSVLGALAVYDFCDKQRPDARLLMSFSHHDLLRGNIRAELRHRLHDLNQSIARAQRDMAVRLYGEATTKARQRLERAVFQVPFGLARECLIANQPMPREARVDLEYAARALLTAPLG